MIAMDLSDAGQIIGNLDDSYWMSFANSSGLKSEMWLTAYEATRKGWWSTSVDKKFISSDEYFTELDARDVEFYKRKRKARTVTHISFLQSAFAFRGSSANNVEYQ